MSEATMARFTCPHCHTITDLIENPDTIKTALAAERRATVERIRERLHQLEIDGGTLVESLDFFAILEEEAAR